MTHNNHEEKRLGIEVTVLTNVMALLFVKRMKTEKHKQMKQKKSKS